MRADVAQHRPDWSPHFKAPKNVYLPVSPGVEERARLCGARRGNKGSLCCLYEATGLDRLREFLPLGYRGEKGLVRVELIPRTAWFGSLARSERSLVMRNASESTENVPALSVFSTSGSSQSFNPFRALPRNRFAALVLRVDER